MKLSGPNSGIAVCAGVLLGLVACGGGGGGYNGMMNSGGMAPTGFIIQNLVSNRAAVMATVNDADLVNPWGIAFNPQGFVWVANNGTSTSTLYDGMGVAQSLKVAIPAGGTGPAAPTGIVFNSTTDFVVSAANLSGASAFIFAGLDGTISGWSPAVNANNASNANQAVTAFDGSASGAVYTGLAIAQDSNGNNFLYAANFATGQVDVFDGTFTKVAASGGFADASVPQGFSPFGIQNIPSSSGSAQIFVTYAQPNAATHGSTAGAGLGYVAVFDATGTLIKHLVSGGALNAPWGIAMAPASFGSMSGALLIGNFGDGAINAYDPTTGASMGALMQPGGQPVLISGLWGIAFGNGIDNQPANTLFFSAGVNGEADGVYGRIDFGAGTASTSPGPGY
jgi:uncharacterized protein (TIGR03118 family)